MRVLNVTRGSYAEVIVGEAPYVQIDGQPKNGTGTLLTDFKISYQEKNSVVQCFNDVNHVFAFGHDPENSTFSVTFLVFLGKKCMKDFKFTSGSRMTEAVKMYMALRVSEKKKTVKITSPGIGYVKGMVLGFDIASYDEELNMATVTYSGKFFGDKK